MLPDLLTAGTTRRPSCVASVFSLFACAVLLLSGSAVASAQTASPRVQIETRTSASLTSAVDAGPLPSSQRLTLTLTLASSPARSAALSQFLTDVTTPSSPHYRKWLTPAQFAPSYGATADQITAASQWAQAQGLTVESTSPAGNRLTISGFASQIQPAFAVSLHSYKVNGVAYYANVQQPSLPASTAALFSAIDGLDNLPANAALTLSVKPTSFAAIAQTVDANTTPILTLSSGLCANALSASQLAQYTALFQQAAAQGITTLSTRTCTSTGLPSALAEVTAVALPGDTAETSSSVIARPTWQSAPGLPADSFRHTPDLTASTASALATTLSSIAVTMPQGRLGNINPILYELAPSPGLYTQPDSAAPGTWEPATGLGLVDLDKLAKAFPRGTGSSFASFSASNYSPMHGQSITFTSNVTSGTGGPTPTGTVSFVNGDGTVIGTGNIVAGTATYTTNQLAGGTYTVKASYSGDATYAPSNSPSGTIFVQPEASQLSVNVSSGNVVGGTYTVAVTDSAASGVGQPGGNVTLTVEGPGTNYTQALTPAGTNSSATTFTVPANTVGTLTLSINCAGDASFSCYNAVTTTVTVAKATPSMSISYSPNPPVSGQTITLNATVSPVGTAPVPTGSVTFFDNSTGLNSGNLNNGTTSVIGTVPTTSTHKITATYNGDPNYNPVTTSGTTNGTTTTSTAIAPSVSTVTAGQSFAVAVTVTPSSVVNGAQPSGTVQILDGTTAVGSGTVTAGQATVSVTLTSTGTHSLTANYLGDTNYAASTSPAATVTVNATGSVATTTTITPSSYTPTYGQPFSITATVTPSSTVKNTAPTGLVNFTLLNGSLIASIPLTNGSATYTPLTPLAPGSYVYVAQYSGDANYAGSYSPGSGTVTVSPAVASIAAVANPTTVATGGSSTITATVTLPGSSVPPTGTVTVTVPGVSGAVYTGNLTATGTNTAAASITVPAPPGGTYTLQVTCAGTANFSCTPTTVGLTSTAPGKIATTTTLTLSPSAPTSGQSVLLTATVAASKAGTSALSGTVTFYNGSTQIGQGTISNGVATASFTLTGTAVQTLTAVYSGDSIYASSTSNAVTVNLALVPSTVTLSSSTASGVAGGNITLTAQVKGNASGGVSPTGQVSFYLTGTSPSLLGTATLSANGVGTAVATFNTTKIPSGSQSVYAVYSGDGVFSSSTSSNISIGQSDYAISFSPAQMTLTAGQTRSATLTVTATGGFAGTITLLCSPPAGLQITCSLNPPTLTGSGTSTLLISTVANKAENHIPGAKTIGGIALAGLFCLLLPGQSKRRRLPALLLLLLAAGFSANLGCASNTSISIGTGTPLGTVNVAIYTAGTSGSQSVHHDYSYQVTVQ